MKLVPKYLLILLNLKAALLFVLALHYFAERRANNNLNEEENFNISDFIIEASQSSEKSPPLYLFNLSRLLKPRKLYDQIMCRLSNKIYVRTTLCVHEINRDVHVSGSIWRSGIWEPHVLNPFLDFVNSHPDHLVIDIGAQIGQYSLFAAKLGRKVVAVEPFFDNLLRIHKAASIEGTSDQITLVYMAVSNRRSRNMLLKHDGTNIGGQAVMNASNDDERTQSKYLVKTVFFDDLLAVLPKNNANETFKNAVLKIDIEAHEMHALERAEKIFSLINIEIIFMEWGSLIKLEKTESKNIEKMIRFLTKFGYEPYAHHVVLDTKLWLTWPWDITWKKKTVE